MRFIALEREVSGVNWENQDELLRDEAAHVLNLKNDGIVEDIFFTETHEAVVFLNGEKLEDVKKLLDEFPLVKAGMIKFEVHGLTPYDGFERLK